MHKLIDQPILRDMPTKTKQTKQPKPSEKDLVQNTDESKPEEQTQHEQGAEEQQQKGDHPNTAVEEKGGSKHESEERSFTVLSVKRDGNEVDFKGGKFTNDAPGSAARKAASQALKTLYGDEDKVVVDITIKETTKNRPVKEYTYRATRIYNDKNVELKNASGQKINVRFKWNTQLKAIKKGAAGNVTEETVADTSTV